MNGPSSATSLPAVDSPRPESGQEAPHPLIADLDSPNRAIWQKPELVIELLGDLTGKTVADIGAGSGYFAFRLVPKAKRVIAIEIDRQCISFMDSVKVRLAEPLRSRFETRFARPNDPLLKPGEADAVTLVNTYGYIEGRPRYLSVLKKGMAPNSKLLIIDFKKNAPVGPEARFRVSLQEVEKELLDAGFALEKADVQSLDYQYIVMASPKK